MQKILIFFCAIIAQDEIQSAHWRHNQATIFTACAWTRNSEQEVECHSYGIISDDLTHSKYCVWVFLRNILMVFKQKHKHITKVIIYSDGCAAQFKNRYNLFNICTAKEDFGVEISWSFFPTSHGKGAVDGIGAVIKRTMWTAVKARKVILNQPIDCYNFLIGSAIKGINILYVSQNDIKEYQNILENRWKALQQIKNIRSKHYFEKSDAYNILAGRTAYSKLEVNSFEKMKK